jgi:hypothetical protein
MSASAIAHAPTDSPETDPWEGLDEGLVQVPEIKSHDPDDIVATQGKCLTLGYVSPALDFVNECKDRWFAHELYMALRLLSERESPRRKLYGDEADESRFGHTPPETRARFSTHHHNMIRAFMRYQGPSTPGDTPPETPELVHEHSDSSPTHLALLAEHAGLAAQEQPGPAPLASSQKRDRADEVEIQTPTESCLTTQEDTHRTKKQHRCATGVQVTKASVEGRD